MHEVISSSKRIHGTRGDERSEKLDDQVLVGVPATLGVGMSLGEDEAEGGDHIRYSRFLTILPSLRLQLQP